MATRKAEMLFPLDKGIETYSPEVSASSFNLSNLEAVKTLFSRLVSVRTHKSEFAFPGEKIQGLAFVFNVGLQSLQFFAITNDKVYLLQVNEDNEFAFTQVGSDYVWQYDDPISWKAWDDDVEGKVYFTKVGTPLQVVSRSGLADVAASYNPGSGAIKLSGRYTAIVQNHLVLANISMGSDLFPRRVQWSDLYRPEDFAIASSKEGDLYDLETGNLEITGLFNHRGYMLVFTRKSIWRAAYVGYPLLFRFEPLYSEFGNIYHYAAISVKDRVYYIGSDNFYVMEGFTPVPIGDDIWNLWNDTKLTTISDYVRSYSDPVVNEVMWIYRRKGRDDVRVGNITVSVETKTKTLLPNGVSGGRNSWKLVEESIVYTVSWNETTSRWEFRSLIGETDTLLYSSLSDDLFSDSAIWVAFTTNYASTPMLDDKAINVDCSARGSGQYYLQADVRSKFGMPLSQINGTAGGLVYFPISSLNEWNYKVLSEGTQGYSATGIPSDVSLGHASFGYSAADWSNVTLFKQLGSIQDPTTDTVIEHWPLDERASGSLNGVTAVGSLGNFDGTYIGCTGGVTSLFNPDFSDPTPGAVVDLTISKDSTWDYRAFDHDWMIVYNYKERRWSTRSPDGMLSFYNNEYPVSAFNVIDDFSSVWTNSRTLTAPVTMNDYPWRQLVFTAQARSSNVVTVTSAAHGLTSGNKINVLGSTPTSFNGSLVPVTVTDVDTFTYPSTGTDETLSGTAIGDSDFRTIDGAWQYLSFPSRLLVGRENDVALYEGGDFTDGQGNETYVEVKSHELFFGSLTDAKEIKAVKLSYTKVGNPDIRMQVGTRNNLNEPIYWTSERLQQTLALDKESRFVFDFDLRSKFFTFRFRVFNTPTDYVDEFMGGSIEVTGMKSKGTEL